MTEHPDVGHRRHLGDQIRRLRRARGLTLQSLADRMGVGRTHLGDLERGAETNPHLDLLIRLLEALDLTSIEQLFSGLPEWGSQVLQQEHASQQREGSEGQASA